MEDRPRRKRRLMEDSPPPPVDDKPPSEPVRQQKPQAPEPQQRRPPTEQPPPPPPKGQQPKGQPPKDQPPKDQQQPGLPSGDKEAPTWPRSFYGGKEDPPPIPPIPPVPMPTASDIPSAPEVDAQMKQSTLKLKKLMEFYGFAKPSEIGENVDLYRDTPVRLFGYAEEIGEVFRPVIPRMAVRATYVVTGAYILADTMDKTVRVSEATWESKKVRQREIEKVVVDTLAWQTLASVFIPGFIISRTCNAVMYLTELGMGKLPRLQRTGITATICFTLIPLIVKPIDKSVDWLLDQTLRKVLKRRTPTK